MTLIASSTHSIDPPAPEQVGIVIPVLNGAAYVEEAIRSALELDRLVGVVVVVDDGSTDQTVSIARAIKDPRLRVLERPANTTRGVSAARNLGLQAIASPWVIFLDADDRLRKSGMERLVAQAREREDCVAVYGDYDRIDERGASRGWRKLIRHRPKPSGELLSRLLRGNFIVNGGVILVKTAVFQRLGGFSEAIHLCEDWYAWCRLSTRGPIYYVRDAHVLDYRVHKTSAVMQFRGIQEYERVFNIMFRDPLLFEGRGQKYVAAARRSAESHLRTYVACQNLRARQYFSAMEMVFGALRVSPSQAPQILAQSFGALVGL